MAENSKKSFLEKFSRYTPDEHTRKLLEAIETDSLIWRVDKDARMIEVSAHLLFVIPQSEIYRIEEEIRSTYDLCRVYIRPHYEASLFNKNSIPDILMETNRRGAVARGFFDGCSYKLQLDNQEKTLIIKIPFIQAGVDLVCDAKTPIVIENLIQEMYGVHVKVNVTKQEGIEEEYYADLEKRREELSKKINENMAEMMAHEQSYSSDAKEEFPQYPRRPSISNEDVIPVYDGNFISISHKKYDISSPELLKGETFELKPTPISKIDHKQANLVIFGEIFNLAREDNRTGEEANVSFDIYDGSSSIGFRSKSLPIKEAKEIESLFTAHKVVALRGLAKKNVRRGKEDIDYSFFYNDVMAISLWSKKDEAENKRVELHLHTTMSSMDALIDPTEIVKKAYKWGHKAVAITDHGNVQGFPDAMLSLEKNVPADADFKVIYGMEAYYVNNTAGALYGSCNKDPNALSIVFDIETTGLSVKNCKITEIGAVKIQNGEVIDTFDTFVNPEVHIPEEITEKTHITDDMVKDAPLVKDALVSFFDFIGNNQVKEGENYPLLIAHNANFDVGFIRHFAKECDLPFENPYLDTLEFSRYVIKDLAKFKLESLANYYKLGEYNAHRACDDALMLAKVYFCLLDTMSKMEIHDLHELQKDIVTNADPLKIKPYHQIILAKNKVGLKNLYQLVSKSYLDYYKKYPRIPKTEVVNFREGLIIGSACEAGELFRAILENRNESEIEDIVNFYDYLEIQPICNNRFLVTEGTVKDDEGLRDLNRKIVELGEKYNKPVCATCDAHFMNPEDEIYRKILMAGMKFSDFDRDVGLYYRTTDEMLEEFAYLGKDKAFEVVVTNPNKIADMVEKIRPIPTGKYTPEVPGADDELQKLCWDRAKKQYGDPLPEIVKARLDKELTSIIKHGFSALYLIAVKLVKFSEDNGYLVGSRGSVGSSFVATMSGISEVNPLKPHYYCPNCQNSEFFTDGSVGSGFDLPDKNCPKCGTKYMADGQDIRFETFLGFHGDKDPDIDLNFSGDVQGKVHNYTEEIFGKGHVFRAGTISALADKTAYGYIAKYVDQKGFSLPRAEMNRLVNCCMGVKKTTGQHPGGIIVVPQKYDVYDFTPVQHPADDPNANTITTHFAFSYLHETILKLDELGHDVPTKYKWLETFSNTKVMDVAMNDPAIYELLQSTRPLGVTPQDLDGCEIGTYGLPEFGTSFVQQTLIDSKPRTFADLLKVSGLTHGTNVWLGNAQDLIKDGICDIRGVIGCRDDVMIDLIHYGLEDSTAFAIMEAVRKGKGLKPEWEEDMRNHKVPDWYINSCKKIKYLFPKAHAAAYVMSSIRLAWYKIHKPVAFYCTMFTVAPKGFDATIVMKGKNYVLQVLHEIQNKGKEASQKELSDIPILQLVNEAMARGIQFLPVDIEKSTVSYFVPENNGIRMPFTSLPGLGESVAQNIVKARDEEAFSSIEDMKIRGNVGSAILELLTKCGALKNLSETNQITLDI